MKQEGSITVFSALCLMLTASFLFALLESARVWGLDAYVKIKSELGLESVCAEYQPELWERYHLLYLDGSYGTNRFSLEQVSNKLKNNINENFDTKWGDESFNGTDLFSIRLVQAALQRYQLATDHHGTAFLRQVSSYMKENITFEAAKRVYEKYTEGKEVENSKGAEYSVEEADQVIRDAKEAKKKEEALAKEETLADGEEQSLPQPSEEEAQENLLEIVLELKRNMILGMVIDDISSVSTLKTDLSERIENRDLQQGNIKEENAINWYEKILVLEYADEYFSDFTSPASNHALSYELEYLICGKEDDQANLEGTVNRLLFLREAANVTHILSDRQKMNESLITANVLAGFTGNPAIIKVVQIGVVAAWAYLESIQDVRALLQGDKIALIKSKDQWTIQPGNLIESFQGASKAKNCSNGFTYQEYLKQFLFVIKDEKLAYRMMDVMEQNIRMVNDNENFRMDKMLGTLSYSFAYEANPLFSRLTVIGRLKSDILRFTEESRFTYY